MADNGMYTDDTETYSCSDDDGERSNQEETATQEQEDQDEPDEEEDAYFVLADPNYTYQLVQDFELDVGRTDSDNAKRYGKTLTASQTLERFQWHQGHLDFHSLQPVRKTASHRVYEPRFGSTNHVDAFLAALPLFEMHKQFLDDNDSTHIYTWLHASLKASKITLSLLQSRQRFYQWEIARLDTFLDGHIEDHIAMKAERPYDDGAIREHTKEGFLKELEYKARLCEDDAIDRLAVWVYQTEVMFPRLGVAFESRQAVY